VQRKDGYYAVVSYGGKTFTPEQAFMAIPRERPVHLVVGASVMSAVPVAIPRPSAFAALQFRVGHHRSVQLLSAVGSRPSVGVQFVQRIF